MKQLIKHTCRTLLAFVPSATLAMASAQADESHFILDPGQSGASFDGGIVSPEEFLGFRIGRRPIRYDEVLLYLKHLAGQSDRVTFAPYGETDSGQMLFTVIVSAPDNLANLAAIHDSLRAIAAGGAERASQTPMVAWMGYGIHGDELSATDASVMLAYRLAAGRDETTRRIRERVITYIDPIYNPEGRARALAHVDALRRHMPATDHQDMVHHQFWMEGRGNRYFFDLNRDATFQVQAQSRHRVKAIRAARPQLFIDAHEVDWDDTYLFAVPARPLNPHLPENVHTSWQEFGDDHGKAFDAIGRSYYTRSWNEVFYPGYYDIWPAYLGAVPILHEQAATAGLSVRQENGKLLTFHTAVSNHYRSSVANLITASEAKDTLLDRWAATRREAAGAGRASKIKSYLILPDDPYKYRETLRVLLSQGIEVERLSSPVDVGGLHSVSGGGPRERRLPEGTLKVPVSQPLGPLVRNILDFHVPMSPQFLADEKRNLDLGHATQIFDVTAWSLPLAFDIETYWTGKTVKGNWTALTEMPAPVHAAVGQANYGYIYRDSSLQATARLLEAGVKIRVGGEPFTHRDTPYAAGTFLVRQEEQDVDAAALLSAEAEGGHIRLVAAERARITVGPDLGGDDFHLLHAPKVGILGGRGVSTTSFGAAWHLLDKAAAIPVTLLDLARLGELDLAAYNVIVLPEVDAGARILAHEDTMAALNGWISQGGTFITLGNASFAAAELKMISSRARSDTLDTHPPLMVGRDADTLLADDFLGLSNTAAGAASVLPPVLGPGAQAYDEATVSFDVAGNAKSFDAWLSDASAPSPGAAAVVDKIRGYLPHGAYLEIRLRPKHWLTYGTGPSMPALFRDADTLIAGREAELAARFAPAEDLMLSGLVWPEATGYIAGTAYLAREKKGRGQIVSFASDPLFRGYSLGTARLFMNALLIGNSFR